MSLTVLYAKIFPKDSKLRKIVQNEKIILGKVLNKVGKLEMRI